MKEHIQSKINQMHSLAKSPIKGNAVSVTHTAQNEDSLSKAIRNKDEANLFIAELNAAIKVANQKKS